MGSPMSGLTKKTVYADKLLATILGVREGEHVSYSELSKGLHKYIKDNNLRSPHAEATEHLATPSTTEATATEVTTAVTKKCRDCGADIPSDAIFCDLCGVPQ